MYNFMRTWNRFIKSLTWHICLYVQEAAKKDIEEGALAQESQAQSTAIDGFAQQAVLPLRHKAGLCVAANLAHGRCTTAPLGV